MVSKSHGQCARWNMVICADETGWGWFVPRRNYEYGQHGPVVDCILNMFSK